MNPNKGEASEPAIVVEGTDLFEMAHALRQVIEEASKSGDREKIELIVSEFGLLALHADFAQLARKESFHKASRRNDFDE